MVGETPLSIEDVVAVARKEKQGHCLPLLNGQH